MGGLQLQSNSSAAYFYSTYSDFERTKYKDSNIYFGVLVETKINIRIVEVIYYSQYYFNDEQ
jgi:hypothetical protein